MRVRFKHDAALAVGGGQVLMLGGQEADVEPAPDGRFKLVIPQGDMAGEEVFVEENLFEPIEE